MKCDVKSSCLQLWPLKVLAGVADVFDGVEAREALDDGHEVAEALQRRRRAARLQNEPRLEKNEINVGHKKGRVSLDLNSSSHKIKVLFLEKNSF